LIKIYALDINKDTTPTFNRCLNLVSKDKQNKIHKFKLIEDKKRSLYAEVLIRSDFNFNISHSGKWVVAAISKNNIGIDIEKIEPINFTSLAKRFFSKCEYNQLISLPIDKQMDFFYSLWIFKESYLKFLGVGLHLSTSSFSVQIDGEKVKINDSYLNQINFDKKYKLAVCSKNFKTPISVKILDINKLKLTEK